MSKKLLKTNIRVEVKPRAPGDFGFISISGIARQEQETIKECEEIAAQIRRHVDGLPYRGDKGVFVEWDREPVCSYCGLAWSEDGDDYNGGCCKEDQKNDPEVLNKDQS